MTRFSITGKIGPREIVQHVIKADTQEEAWVRFGGPTRARMRADQGQEGGRDDERHWPLSKEKSAMTFCSVSMQRQNHCGRLADASACADNPFMSGLHGLVRLAASTFLRTLNESALSPNTKTPQMLGNWKIWINGAHKPFIARQARELGRPTSQAIS